MVPATRQESCHPPLENIPTYPETQDARTASARHRKHNKKQATRYQIHIYVLLWLLSIGHRPAAAASSSFKMSKVAPGNGAVALLLVIALALCALLRPCSSTSLGREEQSGKKPTSAGRRDTTAAAAAAAAATPPTIVIHAGMMEKEQQRDLGQAGQERNLQELEPQLVLSVSEADGVELSVLPSVEESTILFLHVYKVNTARLLLLAFIYVYIRECWHVVLQQERKKLLEI